MSVGPFTVTVNDQDNLSFSMFVESLTRIFIIKEAAKMEFIFLRLQQDLFEKLKNI